MDINKEEIKDKGPSISITVFQTCNQVHSTLWGQPTSASQKEIGLWRGMPAKDLFFTGSLLDLW